MTFQKGEDNLAILPQAEVSADSVTFEIIFAEGQQG